MTVRPADYSHLHAATLPCLEETDEARIRRIRADRWITYARAEAALAALEDLLTFPKRTRMPNLMLVGPTNNGKTMIVEKFRRAHPVVESIKTPEGYTIVPTLKVQMAPGPDEKRFFGAILDAFSFPYAPSDNVVKRQDAAMRLLRRGRVDLLIIDEVHNLLSGAKMQQRRLLNLLRWVGNELQIPLVAVGTSEGLHAIQSDDQLANRFHPVSLPPWRNDEVYRQLLATLEAVLPLRHPSHLDNSQMAGRILGIAEGILGETIQVVTMAAAMAVRTGEESVTLKLLEECGYLPPSKRRYVGS